MKNGEMNQTNEEIDSYNTTSATLSVAGVAADVVFVSRITGAGGLLLTIFLVGFDPVGGYLALGGLEI